MLLSLLTILLVTISGAAITYLYSKEDSLMVRLAAGNVIGQALWGTIGLIVFSIAGFSTTTVLIALVISLLPLAILFLKADIKEKFSRDLQSAKDKLQNATLKRFLNFVYYTAWFGMFCLFFNRAMIEKSDGIFTGASNNLGDLPFHLGAITSFLFGGNFPPENPSFAFTKFSYPFLVDLVASYFVQLGAGLSGALLIQNVPLALSLLILLEHFAVKLTGSRFAARLTPLLFFFSGGLGFIKFFQEYWQGTQGLFEFLGNLPKDYTIRPEILRWGNPMIVLFITQRSLLLGMPIVLIALTKLWEIFKSEEESNERINYELIFTGLIAGMLPLIHSYSLAALFVVCAFLFFLKLKSWKEWITFGAAVSIIAIPELMWAMSGSATRTKEFIGFHLGWDAQNTNILYFWLVNLGAFIPLLIASFYFIARHENEDEEINKKPLMLFYIPFLALFLIPNLFKLAPWEWDNIKILIYWFLASVPLVAWLLKEFAKMGSGFKAIVAAIVLVLTLSGALDIWRVISGAINYQVFSKDGVEVAEQIKHRTSSDAVFLNAPTYNTPVVLSGRRSLMRYSAHLMSHGIDYMERENDLRRIYRGDASAEILLRKYNIDYVLLGPEEAGIDGINAEYFSRLPIVAEAGSYKVYKVKK